MGFVANRVRPGVIAIGRLLRWISFSGLIVFAGAVWWESCSEVATVPISMLTLQMLWLLSIKTMGLLLAEWCIVALAFQGNPQDQDYLKWFGWWVFGAILLLWILSPQNPTPPQT
jgi:hypothetical protein